jgi:hypothetical protein
MAIVSNEEWPGATGNDLKIEFYLAHSGRTFTPPNITKLAIRLKNGKGTVEVHGACDGLGMAICLFEQKAALRVACKGKPYLDLPLQYVDYTETWVGDDELASYVITVLI